MVTEKVKGVVPNLTKLITNVLWTGVGWLTEKVITYAEGVVKAFIWTIVLAVIPAILLAKIGFWLHLDIALPLSVAIGGIGLFCFAVFSSPMRMGADWFAGLSVEVQREINKLSQILMTVVVAIFYIGLDNPINHPYLFWVFVGILVILYFATLLPGDNWVVKTCRTKYVWLLAVPVILMAVYRVVPEAILIRVTDNHWPEKVTGTVTVEIPFRIDEQDQVIDLDTQLPMEFFERVSQKGELPKPRKGWTKDNRGNYHLWTWFEGQGNFTSPGQEIMPITPAKVDDIVIETKRALERKLADEKKIADEQKAITDAETARLKAEADARQALDEIARQQQEEREALIRQQAEAERIAQEVAQAEAEAEQHRLATRPITVVSTILAPTDQSQDVVLVKPSEPFVYREMVIQPEESVVVLGITEVKGTSDKNKYELKLQPQTLMSGGQSYDISRQTDSVSFVVKKDNSNSILKILGGAAAGAVVGAIAAGKKGAVAGAVIGGTAGTVYAMASHGKKFQMVVGDQLPPITIKPVP